MKAQDIVHIIVERPVFFNEIDRIEIRKDGHIISYKIYPRYANWLKTFMSKLGLEKLFSKHKTIKVKSDEIIFRQLVSELDEQVLNSTFSVSKKENMARLRKVQFIDKNNQKKTFSYWTHDERRRGLTKEEEYFEAFILKVYLLTNNPV